MVGPRSDVDGKEAAALELIRAHPNLSTLKLSALLESHGIKRGPEWCRRKKHVLFVKPRLVE